MNSRTVHLRLSDQQVAQCYLLLERCELEPAGSMASAISRAIQLTTSSLELPELSDEEALAVIERWQRAEPEELKLEPDQEPVAAQGELLDDLVLPAEPVGAPPVAGPAPPAAAPQPPWDGHNLVPFQLIQAECPKDRFVEAILEPEEPDPYLLRAVEITYALLGRDQWGSPNAARMIGEFLEHFQRYVEKTGDAL